MIRLTNVRSQYAEGNRQFFFIKITLENLFIDNIIYDFRFFSTPRYIYINCSIQKICTQYKPQADSLEVELTPYIIYVYIYLCK